MYNLIVIYAKSDHNNKSIIEIRGGMIMKKLISLLLMSILMVGILAACGTGGEEAENAGIVIKRY